MGKVNPKGSYWLQSTFTKWVEAPSFPTITAKDVSHFIKTNIIYQFGVPHEMISENGSHFQVDVLALLEEYKISSHKSSSYRPLAKGAVEVANKNLKRILQLMTFKCKEWLDKLPFALWGYRISV